jgi:hypothetical protein
MQVEAFFKKNAVFSEPEKCRAAALSSFLEGERICRIANRRLDHYYIQRERLAPDLEKWLSRMEKDIDRILGPVLPFLESIPEMVRVTAGATASKSRREALPFRRISKRVACTRKCAPYLDALSQYWGYGNLRPKLIEANRVEFVPKNWKTDRTIACEPEGNVFLQLAVDKYIKRRLRRVGIDLTDQSQNQEKARKGSEDGGLSTVDLSMASDTLAYNTVAWLFPKSWFDLLCAIRSSKASGKVPELNLRYAKFSSMGNGCTFTVETLVFAAACRAVGSKEYSVYGDDIVIETEYFDNLRKLLRFLGFSFNSQKSFNTGPFRESCGTNWFQGVDITPIYVRNIDRRKAVLCHLVNSLAAVARPLGHLWEILVSLVEDQGLPFVPYNENTMSGVWVTPHEAYGLGLLRTPHRGKDAWIPKFKAYVPKTRAGRNRDVRSLFLWHLMSLQPKHRGFAPQALFLLRGKCSDPYDYVESSRYSTPSLCCSGVVLELVKTLFWKTP